MRQRKITDNAGFSLIELLISMGIVLLLLGIVSSITYRALGIRARESRKTDALVSAQAALNVMSREISNAGFGIYDNAQTENANNGLILADTGANRLHFRANINNYGPGPISPTCTAVCTSDPGEDVTYFFDNATLSIVRYDPHGRWDTATSSYVPQTSVVVNRSSNVSFVYYNYDPAGNATPGSPSNSTGRIELTVDVTLDPVHGEPNPSSVRFVSEINLRNSSYMLHQY